MCVCVCVCVCVQCVASRRESAKRISPILGRDSLAMTKTNLVGNMVLQKYFCLQIGF